MLQTPSTGHTVLAVHVQIFGALGRGVLGDSLCLFKDESLAWKLGRQEYDTFSVFLLNILERGFEGDKAALTSMRNCNGGNKFGKWRVEPGNFSSPTRLWDGVGGGRPGDEDRTEFYVI